MLLLHYGSLMHSVAEIIIIVIGSLILSYLMKELGYISEDYIFFIPEITNIVPDLLQLFENVAHGSGSECLMT